MYIPQDQHILCILYNIILLAPSMPFFLYHMTNPNLSSINRKIQKGKK